MQAEFTESADLSATSSGLRERITQRLTQAWREHSVEAVFQGLFLESTREASLSQFSEMAAAEAELAAAGQSFAFSLQLAAQGRAEALQRVARGVEELEGKAGKTERDVEDVCHSLEELREANLHQAELLLDLDRFFVDSLRQNCFSPTLARELTRLDEDNHFLRRSLLRKFILFSKSYDPFLLKHQEALRATEHQRLREVRCVEALFTLPASYTYRLEKAQRGCLEYLTRGAAEGGRARNFRIISPVRESFRSKKSKYFSSPKEQPLEELEATSAKLDEELSSFRLDKEAYLSNRPRLFTCTQECESPARKGSDEAPGSPVASTRLRNISVRSSKEVAQLLPRLNTIHSSSSYKARRAQEGSPVAKRYNAHRSINEMEEREQELKTLLLPKKFEKLEVKHLPPEPRREPQPKFKTLERRETSVQCESPLPQQAASPSPSTSPSHREESIQTLEERPQRPARSSPLPPAPPPESRRGKYKKYQLKASKLPLEKFLASFRGLSFSSAYSRILQAGSWQNSIAHNQYYFHKFFVNEELSAVSLSCALPEGDVLIKCWGPLAGCDAEMSLFLFGKLVEHLEKATFCATIFYNNLPIPELEPLGFVRQRERIYERARVFPSLCEKGDYSPFLAVNFSSVAISKEAAGQEQLVVRGGVEEFSQQRFLCFNYLLIVNKLMTAGSFTAVAAYRPRLPSVRESNLAILSQFLSPDAYDPLFRCSYLHLLTLRLRNPIKYAFFLADRGFIKLFGELVYDAEEAVIIALPFLRYSTRLFFGKGIKSAAEMAERCRGKGQGKETVPKVSLSVRMFRKRLRGRLMGVNLKEENTYGDFEVTFSWRDFLKGKIEHDLSQSEELFDSSFYCLLEMERELLFVFEVSPQDFIDPHE